jgi:hypothetical protein
MSDLPIPTRPLGDHEKLMREKFYESVTAQSELMDKLSAQLLTLELAIPGVYATMLKLVSGDKATIQVNAAFYLAFIAWFAALALTLVALTPKKWQVDPALLKQDPQKFSAGLGIEDFFEQSANYKRGLVIASSVSFFVGVFCAAFTIG